MKKDKEWLKDEINNIIYRAELKNVIVSKYNVGQSAITPEGTAICFEIEKKIDELDETQKQVITYFSPFTDLPVLVETETHKYFIDVAEIMRKVEQ